MDSMAAMQLAQNVIQAQEARRMMQALQTVVNQNHTSVPNPTSLNNISTRENNNLRCRASTANCMRRPTTGVMALGAITFLAGGLVGGQLGGNHPISASLQIAGAVIAVAGLIARCCGLDPNMRTVEEQSQPRLNRASISQNLEVMEAQQNTSSTTNPRMA
ncbi:MAG: hypothetical protein V4629_00105 [Pseudomonadota bacterium]